LWPRGRARGGAVSVATGLIAAAATAVVLVLVVGDHRGPRTSSAALPALVRLADVAQRQPSLFPADRQFLYTRSLSTTRVVISRQRAGFLARNQAGRPKALVTVDEQVWVSAARTGAVRSRVVSVRFPSAAARRLWERDGRPRLAIASTSPDAPVGRDRYLLGDLSLTRRQLLETTTDPHRLYDKLYAAGRSAAEVFTEITDTLRNRPAPPRLRAALFRALALTPGVQSLGTRRDTLGRAGVAFAMDTGEVRSEVIIDPHTSQTLEERTLVLPDGARALGLPAGTATSTTTYQRRAVTDAIRAPGSGRP